MGWFSQGTPGAASPTDVVGAIVPDRPPPKKPQHIRNGRGDRKNRSTSEMDAGDRDGRPYNPTPPIANTAQPQGPEALNPRPLLFADSDI